MGSYHKEVMKTFSLGPSRITMPYMSLQDGDFAKIILVALPERTPMREAKALQNDSNRAGIETHSCVINQSLSILENLSDPVLVKRAQAEVEIINQIKDRID